MNLNHRVNSCQLCPVNSFQGFKLCSMEIWSSAQVCLDSMGVFLSDGVSFYSCEGTDLFIGYSLRW